MSEHTANKQLNEMNKNVRTLHTPHGCIFSRNRSRVEGRINIINCNLNIVRCSCFFSFLGYKRKRNIPKRKWWHRKTVVILALNLIIAAATSFCTLRLPRRPNMVKMKSLLYMIVPAFSHAHLTRIRDSVAYEFVN